MASLWLDLLINLGPIFLFVILMIFIYLRGGKQNKVVLQELEDLIDSGLKQRGISFERVRIRPDEYEYRCKMKSKQLRILTLHLKLVNRSFIIQWIINLMFKEREKLFIGAKFGGESGTEDPAYRFDLVPYHKKSYISKRFDYFVDMDDISTLDKEIDKKFMVKSQSASYVKHFTENLEILQLLKNTEANIEHIGLQSSKEETDPHFSATYTFFGQKKPAIIEFLNLFFLISAEHHKNHASVKKLVAKGKKGKYSARGTAKRGTKKKKRKQK